MPKVIKVNDLRSSHNTKITQILIWNLNKLLSNYFRIITKLLIKGILIFYSNTIQMPPNFVWSQGIILRDISQILVIFGHINKFLKFMETLFTK